MSDVLKLGRWYRQTPSGEYSTRLAVECMLYPMPVRESEDDGVGTAFGGVSWPNSLERISHE